MRKSDLGIALLNLHPTCPKIIISLDEYLDIEEKFMQQLDVLREEYPPKYKTIHIVKNKYSFEIDLDYAELYSKVDKTNESTDLKLFEDWATQNLKGYGKIF